MSEKAAKRLEKKWQEHEQALRDKAIKACVVTPEGRALLWWLLGISQVDHQPFVLDPYSTAFNCGQLNVGQQIKAAIIEVDPAGYVNLLQERAKEHGRRTEQLNDLAQRDNVTYYDPDDASDDTTGD